MDKVLITGASGFLGGNLAREFYRSGYEVRIFVRPGANLDAIRDIPCEIFYGQIDNSADLTMAVNGCAYVVHTAAVTDPTIKSYREYERINYYGTRCVADACLLHNIRRLVFVSTANTIGPGDERNHGTELNGFSLIRAHSHYISTKYLAQQYVLEQVQQKGLNAVVVNPTFMLGPRDNKPSSGRLLLYALKKRIVFYPPGGKNFVYIGDVCRGIINSLRYGSNGECYLLAGENMTYARFFKTVKTVAGRRALSVPLPSALIWIATFIAALAGRISGKAPTLNYSMAYLANRKIYYSGKKSTSELLIQYTPLEEAIRQSITWFRENNYCR